MTKRILIIEDEDSIRDLYLSLLNDRDNFKVDEAVDGQEGFRKATTKDYDLIISDLKMPNWNGIDAIKSIALIKPEAKFIVVTGYIESEMADELKVHSSVLEMFSKPVDLEKLLAAIESV